MHFFALQGLLFSSLLLLHYSKAQGTSSVNCNYASNYTSGSAFQDNLNLVLSSLAVNSSLAGYLFTSHGQHPDVVYGLAQCTSGISTQDCQTCAVSAAKEIIQACPNQKEAFIHYGNCLLEYSYQNFYSVVRSNVLVGFINTQNATDPVVFNGQLGSLLESLSMTAALSPLRSAVGTVNNTYLADIYAMMQCTRDLSANSCFVCLQSLSNQIPDWCGGKQGARLFYWSCELRFEVYPFPPFSGTNSFTNPDGNKSTSRILVLLLICAALLSLVLLLVEKDEENDEKLNLIDM
ncbi:hypothetical protein Vadar_005964 [Vaccinium darrowii]|uniref:Uncharacterized protein n=1 Tax=Vaccinium darrowii TaxID=229202 RepID=A0ACB7Z2U1_9ERIC|nr:hypothetical protein Vadar_005964 [Vaccinium darrowii]